MIRFHYIARNQEGSLKRGELTAASRTDALAIMGRSGSQVVSITPIENTSNWRSWLRSFSWIDAMGPRRYDVEIALQQLALMIRSGLRLTAALQSVAEQTRSKALRKVLGSLVDGLQKGNSLHSALEKYRVFPRVLVRLVAVGESTGQLADVLEQGAKHMTQQRKRGTAIIAMLAYPICVMAAAGAVSIYLVLGVIPKLQTFLTAMGRPLPRMTQSLLAFSQAMQSYAPYMVVAVLAMIGLAYGVYRTVRGRLMLDRWVFSIPLLGTILRLSGTITFSNTLSAMLRSGVSLVDALSAIEKLHFNRHLANTVISVRQAIVRGQSLTASLSCTNAYMPLLSQMMAIAEQTGKTNEILDQVTKFHEEQLQAMTKRLSSIMEPTLIVFIGSFVGYVYIAFFVALMSAGGSGR